MAQQQSPDEIHTVNSFDILDCKLSLIKGVGCSRLYRHSLLDTTTVICDLSFSYLL